MFIVHRSEDNPLLAPRKEHPWEAAAVFNWCPIKDGATTHVLYRAMSARQLLEEPKINRSVIGRASTTDDKTFFDREPFIVPDRDFDRFGCEDPRVTKIGKRYYAFYTALSTYPFSADGIRVAVAVSDDLRTVKEKHLVTPFNAKAMALFPEKVGGKYMALLTVHPEHPPSKIAFARFEKLEDMWDPAYWERWQQDLDNHVLDLRRGDDDQVELGAVPLKTAAGWLILYSHISHYHSGVPTFGVEAVLLDLKNPLKILGRTKGAFLVPELYYEKIGVVANICFPSGAMVRGKTLEVYYGAGDTTCCKATLNLDHLLSSMKDSEGELVTRSKKNPIITPRDGMAWEAKGTFNPAAIEIDKTVHILYRAQGADDTSVFGYAASKDGVTITERSDQPVYGPRADIEQKKHPGNSGCEDPRVVTDGEKIFMTYTAYDGELPRVAITSIPIKDFKAKKWDAWSLPRVITPRDYPNKDAVLFPEKTAHGYVFIHRVDSSICADLFENLDIEHQEVRKCIEMLEPRPGMWDGRRVGIAGPPIKTKKGWVLFYHGISEHNTYRVGAALLDLADPTIVRSRTAAPIFEPRERYEREGFIPNVVFPCGSVVRGDTVFLYYGAADTVVGVATLSLKKILAVLEA